MIASIQKEMIEWALIAQNASRFIPYTHRVPMDAVMRTMPKSVTDLIPKPSQFFMKNPLVFETTRLAAPDTETWEKHLGRHLAWAEPPFVRRIVDEKDENMFPVDLFPEFRLPPAMVLGLAYAIPSNFVPVQVVEHRVKEAVPLLASCDYPLPLICAMFPSLFETIFPPPTEECPRVRSRVSSFEAMGRKVPHTAVESILSTLLESVAVNAKDLSQLTKVLRPQQHQTIRDLLHAMNLPNEKSHENIKLFMDAHSVYFKLNSDTFSQSNPSRTHPPLSLYARVPSRDAVERWLLAAPPEHLEAAATLPEGFDPVSFNPSNTWTAKNKRL